MSMAMCPYCSTKLQIPGNISAGMAMLCGNCNNQFLPPQVSSRRDDDDEEDYTPRKKKRKKGRKKMAGNTVATLVILGCIVLLLSGLGIFYLMEPSYAKFNESIVSQYNRMTAVMQSTLQNGRVAGNNLPAFLKQFQPLGGQLKPILKDLQDIRAPEDAKYVLQSFNAMVESLIRFSDQDVPKLTERLRKMPNDQQAQQELALSLIHIAEHHQSLVSGQNAIAKKHGLLQIQAGGDRSFFSIRDR
jgi:hypothetical protein